jgi:hypothetical protein
MAVNLLLEFLKSFRVGSSDSTIFSVTSKHSYRSHQPNDLLSAFLLLQNNFDPDIAALGIALAWKHGYKKSLEDRNRLSELCEKVGSAALRFELNQILLESLDPVTVTSNPADLTLDEFFADVADGPGANSSSDSTCTSSFSSDDSLRHSSCSFRKYEVCLVTCNVLDDEINRTLFFF